MGVVITKNYCKDCKVCPVVAASKNWKSWIVCKVGEYPADLRDGGPKKRDNVIEFLKTDHLLDGSTRRLYVEAARSCSLLEDIVPVGEEAAGPILEGEWEW